MNKPATALYIRLSSEDSDINEKDESNSITSQRVLLKRYVAAFPELCAGGIEEFCEMKTTRLIQFCCHITGS